MTEPYWEPLAAAPAPGLTLIQDQIVGATAVASVIFDLIPQTYKHLLMETAVMQSGTVTGYILARLNGLSTTIYDNQIMYAQAGTVAGGEAGSSNGAYMQIGYYQNAMFDAKFLNYTSAYMKWIRSSGAGDWGGHTNGAGGRHISEMSSMVNLLVPVTRIDIISPTTFLTGSRFTLYGMP